MSMVKEFKEFAMRGSLVDTAVAFVMGAAFGKIVSAFIDGIIMPLVGMLTGGVDFNDQKLILQKGIAAVKDGDAIVTPEVAEVSLKYGTFITNVIDFVVVAFVVFIVIKGMNAAKKKEEAATPAPEPAAPSNEEVLLSEIRDLLKK
ncbi:MAG: large-conductance mechanosensitive channel protein MscL [Bacteroidota bacterium]